MNTRLERLSARGDAAFIDGYRRRNVGIANKRVQFAAETRDLNACALSSF